MKSKQARTLKTASECWLRLTFFLLFFGCLIVGCVTDSAQKVQISSLNEKDWSGLQLWYRQPAEKWTEALPVGNGRLGAMVFGGTTAERIQLNEDTLWAGPPVAQDRAGAYTHIAEARKLIFEGRYSEAQSIVQREVMGPAISPRSHQTLGNLWIRMTGGTSTNKSKAVPALSKWRRGGEDAPANTEYVQPDFDDSGWAELVVESGRFVKGDPSVAPNKKAVFIGSFELTTEEIEAGLGNLSLGPIDDTGTIYLNGKEAGRTKDYSKPNGFDVRKYLKAGGNVIVVIVGNVGGPGGMTPSVIFD